MEREIETRECNTSFVLLFFWSARLSSFSALPTIRICFANTVTARHRQLWFDALMPRLVPLFAHVEVNMILFLAFLVS